MYINAQTKIATLLKHHPGALEAIVTLSPDFNKLRNPVLRKLMAGRTSIAMASKIGGCTPKHFFDVLQPLGFEVNDVAIETKERAALQEETPVCISPAEIITLDVRPVLAAGNDPLSLIQRQVKSLQQGQVLKIVNSFEPVPLIALLAKQGCKSRVVTIADDEVETYFYKTTTEQQKEPEHATVPATGDWDALLQKYHHHLRQIDVREMEMPQPMMTILEALATLPPTEALYVYHKRIPVFLLPELKDRQFEYRAKTIQANEVHLLIFKP